VNSYTTRTHLVEPGLGVKTSSQQINGRQRIDDVMLQLLFAHSPSPISLPRIGEQVGLCNVLFEDCSAFTHITACTLAKSLNDPLHQRLQPLRYLHDCSDCFRLEQHHRVGFAPTEKRRLNTAHANCGHSCLCINTSFMNNSLDYILRGVFEHAGVCLRVIGLVRTA
jgi:hypothetical protein